MKRKSSYMAHNVILFLLLAAGAAAQIGFAAPSNDPKKGMQAAEYHYNPVGKPDPFRPFVERELVLKKTAEKTATVSIFPLQRYSLDQFNLVGIAGDAKWRIAIVETKDNKGKSYPLMLGTVIGLNNGKVMEIRSDRIIVAEMPNVGKRGKINNITIRLHGDNEEGTP